MSESISQPPSEVWRWRDSVREVWCLAWPAIVQQSLLSMVFVVDRALAARHSQAALAAMHAATALTFALATVLSAPAVAALAAVGRCHGAGDVRGAAAAAKTSLLLAAASSSALALAAWLARRTLCAWLFPQAGGEASAGADAYLGIVLPALPLGVTAATAAACLQATRDTRTPLAAALGGHAVNLLLSSVLVFGLAGAPALGVTGIAIGNAAAFVIQAALLGRALWSARSPLPLRDTPAAPLRPLARLALPVLGERSAYQGAYLTYAATLAVLGPVAMAAHQSLLAMEALSFTLAEGFGVAAAALAANHLGKGRAARADRAASAAVLLTVTSLGVWGAAMLALRTPLCALLCPDGAADEAFRVLPLVAIIQPLIGVAVVTCAALRGAGHTQRTLWITLGATAVLRLSAAFALTPILGLRGAWIAAGLDWAAQALAAGVLLAGGRWRRAAAPRYAEPTTVPLRP